MTYYKGVNVEEGESISEVEGISRTVSGMPGTFERGPINKAIQVSNMAAFERIFGRKALTGITNYYDIKSFYHKVSEAPLAVINVKGSSAAKATKTIQDIDGTPENTLKIDAASEGAWGNNLTVKVENDNILSTTLQANIAPAATSATLTSTTGLEIGSFLEFDNGTQQEKVELTSVNQQTNIVQWVGGLTNAYTTANGVIESQEFKITIYEHAIEVESWPGLSMNDSKAGGGAVSMFCEAVINDNSNYIIVTDLDSATTPNYNTMPAATSGAESLTGGDDDLTGLELSDWQGSASSGTGVYAFLAVPNLFRIGCPNPKMNTSPDEGYITLVQDMLAFAKSQHITLYQEVPYNKTPAEVLTFEAHYEGKELSLFYHWIKATVNGSIVWLPPTGGALGAAARKDYDQGVHKNLGGESLAYGTDVEGYLSVSDDNMLNDAGVNVIIADQGLIIWGGRTQSALTKWRFINHVEQYHWICMTLKHQKGWTYGVNSSDLWAKMTRQLTAFFNGLVAEGGVLNYTIACDEFNNPKSEQALGRVHCYIDYEPAGVAEKIIFKLTSSPSGISTQLA